MNKGGREQIISRERCRGGRSEPEEEEEGGGGEVPEFMRRQYPRDMTFTEGDTPLSGASAVAPGLPPVAFLC